MVRINFMVCWIYVFLNETCNNYGIKFMPCYLIVHISLQISVKAFLIFEVIKEFT